MLKGLLKLSWIETKVFLREPLGVIGSLGMPVLLFVLVGRAMRTMPRGASRPLARLPFNVTILAAILIALGAVQSLIAIMAIYREGGILKRLRATPLSPVTILGAHVLVKLGFTFVSLLLLNVAGRRILPGALPDDMVSFTAAVMLGTLSILSLGFVLASIVPTARFAQPLGAAVMYPMLAISGLFFPVHVLPLPLRAVAYALPTTHAVALMQGVWDGAGWSAQMGSVAALLALFAVCIALSARWFRWE
ncbi:MAG TPA: ABC transporter permease [Gemmatimonadaceae bacterium]|jgi:ABC-2 type transport system permease protein|nr:ABC transporter permease [Gemmatimonadaceae bacterium]